MLANECKTCRKKRECETRFISVRKGEKVCCPDGSSYFVTNEYQPKL